MTAMTRFPMKINNKHWSPHFEIPTTGVAEERDDMQDERDAYLSWGRRAAYDFSIKSPIKRVNRENDYYYEVTGHVFTTTELIDHALSITMLAEDYRLGRISMEQFKARTLAELGVKEDAV